MHARLVKTIRKKHRVQSFANGKTVTMKNVSKYHPEGTVRNVVAVLEGSDPLLKRETVIVAARLNHLGKNPLLLPGANDNASGVAVLLTVAFIFFGAEEQGVLGSEFYLKHPPPALPYPIYHTSLDSPAIITPEIMVALAGCR